MTVHTVWMYWPEDDAIELHGALDDHVLAENYDAYADMLEAAYGKVGREHVREIKIEVDWDEVCAAFEPRKIEGMVKP
jgi:hypothetical protein